MDKVVLLLVVAFAAMASAGTLKVSDILAPKINEPVPVEPVEESDEQEGVVVADGSGDEDVVAAVKEEVVDPSVCADITGVWQQQDSEAKLVIVQDVESQSLRGLFRQNSESGWFELSGRHAHHAGGAFAFTMIGEEGRFAASAVGTCHACTGSLELHGVHSVIAPGCETQAMAYLHKTFTLAGDAEEAQTLVKVVFGEEEEEEEAVVVAEGESEQGSGDE